MEMQDICNGPGLHLIPERRDELIVRLRSELRGAARREQEHRRQVVRLSVDRMLSLSTDRFLRRCVLMAFRCALREAQFERSIHALTLQAEQRGQELAKQRARIASLELRRHNMQLVSHEVAAKISLTWRIIATELLSKAQVRSTLTWAFKIWLGAAVMMLEHDLARFELSSRWILIASFLAAKGATYVVLRFFWSVWLHITASDAKTRRMELAHNLVCKGQVRLTRVCCLHSWRFAATTGLEASRKASQRSWRSQQVQSCVQRRERQLTLRWFWSLWLLTRSKPQSSHEGLRERCSQRLQRIYLRVYRSQQQFTLFWAWRLCLRTRDISKSAYEFELEQMLILHKASLHDLQVAMGDALASKCYVRSQLTRFFITWTYHHVLVKSQATVHELQVTMGDALASKCHIRAQLARFFSIWSCQRVVVDSQATADVMLMIHRVRGRKLQLEITFSHWRSALRRSLRASAIYLHNRRARMTMVLVLASWMQISCAAQWFVETGSKILRDVFLSRESSLIEWAVRQSRIRIVGKILWVWRQSCTDVNALKVVKLAGRVARRTLEQKLSHQAFIHWVNLRLDLKAGHVIVDAAEQLWMCKIMHSWWTICLQSTW